MYFWELVKKVVRQVEDLSFFYFFYFFYKKVKKSIKKYFQLFLMLWMGDDANHVALLGFKGPFNSTISFQGFSLSLSQGNTLSLQKLCPSRCSNLLSPHLASPSVLGSSTLGFSVTAFEAVLANSMLVVPSAGVGLM